MIFTKKWKNKLAELEATLSSHENRLQNVDRSVRTLETLGEAHEHEAHSFREATEEEVMGAQAAIDELRSGVSSLSAQIDEVKAEKDLVAAAVKMTDEIVWKLFALMRIFLVSGVLNPKDATAILGIEDETTFLEWVEDHNRELPTEVRKFFSDILQLKDHKDPG